MRNRRGKRSSPVVAVVAVGASTICARIERETARHEVVTVYQPPVRILNRTSCAGENVSRGAQGIHTRMYIGAASISHVLVVVVVGGYERIGVTRDVNFAKIPGALLAFYWLPRALGGHMDLYDKCARIMIPSLCVHVWARASEESEEGRERRER